MTNKLDEIRELATDAIRDKGNNAACFFLASKIIDKLDSLGSESALNMVEGINFVFTEPIKENGTGAMKDYRKAAAMLEAWYFARRGKENKSSRQSIFAELDAERIRQDTKWGEQNWDMATDTEKENSKDLEKIYKGICNICAENKTLTWFSILLEEVFEAFAEDTPDRQYDELVQAGAVIVSMLECLRRRGVKA